MGYSYDFGYDYGFSGPGGEMMDEIMTKMLGGFGMVFAGIAVVFVLTALAVVLTTYVFRSLGLYGIAKRRGIRNPWMAWVPVLRDWMLGCISDQFQYVVKGNVKNRRMLLLILSVAGSISGVAGKICSAAFGMTGGSEQMAAATVIGVVLVLVGAAVSITYAVFYYIAMYDLYTSCSPQNSVMFLVLSIVFRVTEPFFIFFNRKKDDGMPPRREKPEAPAPEELQEGWPTPDYL